MAKKLKLKLATLEGLPAGLADYYEKVGDVYILQGEEVDGIAIEDVTALRKSLKEERAEKDEAVAALKPFKGMDPKKIAKLVEKQKEIDDWKPDAATEEIVSKRTKDIKDKYDSDVTAKATENAGLLAENDGLLIGFAIESAFKTHGAFEDRARPSVLPRIRVERAEGKKPTVYVVDVEGKPITTKAPGKSDRMGVDEYVSSLKQDKNNGWMFKGSGASGTGAAGSAGGNANAAREISMADASKNLKDVASGAAVVNSNL